MTPSNPAPVGDERTRYDLWRNSLSSQQEDALLGPRDHVWAGWQARAALSSSTVQQVGADALDAARYRWLRERNAVLDDAAIFTAIRVSNADGSFSHNDLIAGEEMDGAIDAAIASSPKSDGGKGS